MFNFFKSKQMAKKNDEDEATLVGCANEHNDLQQQIMASKDPAEIAALKAKQATLAATRADLRKAAAAKVKPRS
jgi:hypothetical protein